MLDATNIAVNQASINLEESAAPIPLSVEQTGLSRHFLQDLLAKHLYAAGDLDQTGLTQRTGLAWQVIDSLIVTMRETALIEIRRGVKNEMRYGLTEQGKNLALDAVARSAYTGPAPVTLDQYSVLTEKQTIHRTEINLETMQRAYADVVIGDALLSQLGAAILSGRSILIYGAPGTGKTFIAQRVARVLSGSILVPYAILIADKIIKIYDPVVHKPAASSNDSSLVLTGRDDPRYVRCHRPVAMTGGELTLDMLEINYDSDNKVYDAPSHMKANNGVFIVDDLGRQRIRPMDLLNRWIIPMEEKRDFHALGGSNRFEVPSDIVLIFSTNMDPLQLADEAFLRRLGYKIEFQAMKKDDYKKVWQQECHSHSLAYDSSVFDFLMEQLYGLSKQTLVPCHPRDLIGLVMDQCQFQQVDPEITTDRLRRAWNSYFVASQNVH